MTDRVDIERFKANFERQNKMFEEAFKFHGLDKKPVSGRVIDLEALNNAAYAINVMKAMLLKPRSEGKDVTAQEQRIKALELGIFRSEELYGFVINANRKLLAKENEITALGCEVERLSKENEKLKQTLNAEI